MADSKKDDDGLLIKNRHGKVFLRDGDTATSLILSTPDRAVCVGLDPVEARTLASALLKRAGRRGNRGKRSHEGHESGR